MRVCRIEGNDKHVILNPNPALSSADYVNSPKASKYASGKECWYRSEFQCYRYCT